MTLSYTIPARLYPTLLTCFPVGLAILAWFPDRLIGWSLIAGLATSCGLTMLLSQLGRDPGRNKQVDLWISWGGKPTTQLLRHRDRQVDKHTKSRYHAKLAEIVPGITIPTPDEETQDTRAADEVYDSCALYLIQHTRNAKEHPLVFKENVNYGFRRNLWGMKPAGTLFSVIGLMVAGLAAVIYLPDGIRIAALGGTVMNAFFLAWWLLRITPDWVRVPAFAYARELLAACDKL